MQNLIRYLLTVVFFVLISCTAQAFTITGTSTTTIGSTHTYTAGGILDCDLVWTVTGGTIVSPCSNTTTCTTTGASISVRWNCTSTGTHRVYAEKAGICPGNGQLDVTVNAVTMTPGTISGTAAACPNVSYSYSIPAATNATSYVWSLSSGAGSITSGQNTRTVTVTWSNPGGARTVTVTPYHNVCASSQSSTKNVTVSSLVGATPNITGAAATCQGATAVSYSITAVPNATDYAWTLPPGASLATGSNTNAITVNFSAAASSGTVSVTPSNSCGSGTTKSIAVTVNPLPSAAVTPAGPTSACVAGGNMIYAVSAIANASSYTWTVTGGTVVSGAGTQSISVNWTTAGTGTVTVRGTNSCGNGTAASQTVTVYAQPPTSPDTLTYSHSQLSGAVVQQQMVNHCGISNACGNRSLSKAELIVRLNTGSDYELGTSSFAATMIVEIKGYNAYSGGSLLFTQTKTMTIGTDAPEQWFIYNFTSSYPQVQRFDIRVLSYSCSAVAQPYITLKTHIETTYASDARLQTVTLNSVNLNPAGTNKLTFSWNPACNGFSRYEFQLLRLFNNDAAFATTPATVKVSVDWGSALTIETGAGITSLTLALTEGTGYYAWRVRPIGDKYPGGIANDLNWGNWSATGPLQQNAAVIVTGNISPYCFYFTQPEQNLNWAYTRVFTENTEETLPVNIKESMQYANGIGQSKQSQSLLSSTNQVLTSQTLYDFSGRSSIAALSSPVPQNYFQYIPQFVQQTSGTLYSAAHFDDDANYRNPLPMNAGYPSVYYSDNTPSGDSSIPAASFYPYVRTLYSNDGLNRVAETSQPGAHHRISNEPGYVKHTSQVMRAGVSEDELLRIFGDEAPNAARVRKKIIIDADNRAVVSYVTDNGLTIATCLADGANPENLDALSESHGPVLTVNDFIADGTPLGNNGISAGKPVAFVAPTTLKVYYSISPRSISADCGSYCSSCDYRVYFYLHNLSDPYAAGYPKKDSLIIPAGACPASPQAVTPYIQYNNLPPGSYLVEKRLFTANVNPNTGRTYLDEAAAAYRQSLEAELAPLFAAIMTYVNSDDLDGLNMYLGGTLGLPLSSDGSAYLLSTNCCTISIPKESCTAQTCSPVDFEQQLLSRWSGDTELNFGNTIDLYFQPAWTGSATVQAGDINTLVTNMLNDPLSPYPCGELRQCWSAIVEGYKATRAQFMAQGKNYDPIAHFMECAGREFNGISTVRNSGIGPAGYSNPGYLSHAYRRFRFDPVANSSCISFVNEMSASLGMNRTYPYSDTAHWHWRQLYDCAFNYSPGGNVDAQALADTLENDCKSVCDMRYEGFVLSIAEAYRHDSRYVIEGEGTPGPGQTLVTWQSIWCSATTLVENCRNGCSLTVFYSQTPPPLHATNAGNSAELLAMQKAMTWTYEVNLPNSSNSCSAGFSQVTGQHDAMELLLDYLNNELDEFKAGIGPGTSYFHVDQAVAAYDANVLATNTCITAADSIAVTRNSPGLFERRNCNLVYTVNGNIISNVCAMSLCTLRTCAPVCFNWVQPFIGGIPDTISKVTCAQEALSFIRETINQQRQACLDAAENAFRQKYVAVCTNLSGLDSHRLNYSLDYYHYTLSYYDRASRMLRSVPPSGVQFLDPAIPAVKNRQVHPAHTFTTEYEYNSLNQLIRKESVDGGEEYYFYNKIGQIRFSQTAQQYLDNAYEYTKFDALGRAVEKGRSTLNGSARAFAANVESATYPSSGTEKIFLVYSVASGVNYSASRQQRYLQNRVSYAYNDKDGSAATAGDRVYTYYSYDPHGNVEWCIQELPELGRNYIRYEYETVSRKTLKVVYNEGLPDQYMHRYRYDADNRLVRAETSPDGRIWDRDATYEYYVHGPLKRVLIGEDKVQGLDYVHTISGKLKAMNHPSLNKVNDPGKDAAGTSKVARDAFGMILTYFKNDFLRNGSSFNSDAANKWFLSGDELFAGNVTSWVMNSAATGNGLQYENATGFTYTYDLIGRLKQAKFNNFNGTGFAELNDYQVNYSYDAAGNLLTLLRNGYTSAGLPMDNLTYHYYPGTNRLKFVTDAVTATAAYANDFETQSNTSNYTYDASGNLKTDAQNNSTIGWNSEDKIDQVLINPAGTASDRTVAYTYDASGRRIMKKETGTVSGALINQQFYVYSPAGSVMAIYKKTVTVDTSLFTLIEMPLLSGSRMGSRVKNILVKKLVSGNPVTFTPVDTSQAIRDIARKIYELSDHLGNVRVTVSDVKEPVNAGNLSLGFTARVQSVTNYDPFGAEMAGRNYASNTCRYGFNGMEKEDELMGSGNSYSAEFWQYDPRLGRRWNIDPVFEQSESPYAAFRNNPVSFIDPRGDTPEDELRKPGFWKSLRQAWRRLRGKATYQEGELDAPRDASSDQTLSDPGEEDYIMGINDFRYPERLLAIGNGTLGPTQTDPYHYWYTSRHPDPVSAAIYDACIADQGRYYAGAVIYGINANGFPGVNNDAAGTFLFLYPAVTQMPHLPPPYMDIVNIVPCDQIDRKQYDAAIAYGNQLGDPIGALVAPVQLDPTYFDLETGFLHNVPGGYAPPPAPEPGITDQVLIWIWGSKTQTKPKDPPRIIQTPVPCYDESCIPEDLPDPFKMPGVLGPIPMPGMPMPPIPTFGTPTAPIPIRVPMPVPVGL